MNYMILIYNDEKGWAAMPPSARDEANASFFAYTKELKEAGVMRGGDGLQPTSTATTVRIREGKRLVTDGPFAETKEQLGGFYLIECKDIDEATKWAAKVPSAAMGSVEVRPVMIFSEA
jgi:hypothetical protein